MPRDDWDAARRARRAALLVLAKAPVPGEVKTRRCPPATPAQAARIAAAALLDTLDAVADGGWWALGVRRPPVAELIAQVPTSRPDTGARTLAALRAAGCRVVELPELSDVDTWEDATAVASDVPGGRFATTVAAVSAMLSSRR